MSWLQLYTLRLRTYERSATTGKVHFVIQLQVGQQDDSRVTDIAKRSYSEFRALWKDLQQKTGPAVDEIDLHGDFRRSTRVFPSRESWSNVSRLITDTLSSGRSGRNGRARRRRSCKCAQTNCPFQRLYHLLKDFPFPRKQLLQHKDSNALEQRRRELEDFLVQLQRFFCGYPRSFLETSSSTQLCAVIRLISDFTGIGERPAALSAVSEPFLTQVERPRFFSYCAGSPVSPSTTLNTDLGDSTEELYANEESDSPNNQDEHKDTTIADPRDDTVEASERASVRSSAAIPHSLPQLQIKSANVKTYRSSLEPVRENLLRMMGAEVQAAIEQSQLSVEAQWEFALYQASEQGLYADVVTILRRGTDVNGRVWSDATPLHAACSGGHIHVVQCLLSHGADVNAFGPMGMTPLMWAVNNSQLESTKLLLRAGADPNLNNVRNVSAVHLAVANRCMPLLLLLLDYGATVDVPNSVNGRTPLHIAAEAGDRDMCELLLKYGARLSHCNAAGRSATELAIEYGHWSVQELCNHYRSGMSEVLLEEGEGEDDCDDVHSGDRVYEPGLSSLREYLEDGNASHGDLDVATVVDDGTVYAVL